MLAMSEGESGEMESRGKGGCGREDTMECHVE